MYLDMLGRVLGRRGSAAGNGPEEGGEGPVRGSKAVQALNFEHTHKNGYAICRVLIRSPCWKSNSQTCPFAREMACEGGDPVGVTAIPIGTAFPMKSSTSIDLASSSWSSSRYFCCKTWRENSLSFNQ